MSKSVYLPMAAAVLGIPFCRVSLTLWQGKVRSKDCTRGGHDHDQEGSSPPSLGPRRLY